MKNFTMQNTEGFSKEELAEMNNEFDELMAKALPSDLSDENYYETVQRISEFILNKR